MSNVTAYLLVVDRRSQEDLLFWSSLARSLAHRPAGAPVAVLHEPGEAVERALEGEGHPVRDAAGRLLLDDTGTMALARRAFIEENRKAASVLSDEGVSAVAFLGTTRGLLERSGASWLSALLTQAVIPVVSAVTGSDLRPAETPLDRSAAHLARALGAVVALLGRPDADGLDRPVSVLEARKRVFRPEILDSLLEEGLSVRVTDVSGMHKPDPGRLVDRNLV